MLSRNFKFICPTLAFFLWSCSGSHRETGNDSTKGADFHADNDIAMIVSSLADAISIGEPLDSSDYNFAGVLTDGTGRPLYTNLNGHAGKWKVEIKDSTRATIKNTEIGDLMVDDLRNYIISSLHLDNEKEYVARDDVNRLQTIYSIPNGYLSLVVRQDSTVTGIKGELVSIGISRQD